MKWAEIHHAVKINAAASVEPMTYAEAKALLRLADDTDQTLVTSYIAAARAKLEEDTGRRLITQKWDLYLDRFPSDAILVPFEPLTAVDSIKVTSRAGVQSTVASSVYQVDTASSPPRIVLAYGQVWPTDIRHTQGIVITCSVGYGAAGSAVPGPLLRAMEQLIRSWYMDRVGAPYAPPPKWFGYDATIAPYRIVGLS